MVQVNRAGNLVIDMYIIAFYGHTMPGNIKFLNSQRTWLITVLVNEILLFSQTDHSSFEQYPSRTALLYTVHMAPKLNEINKERKNNNIIKKRYIRLAIPENLHY